MEKMNWQNGRRMACCRDAEYAGRQTLREIMQPVAKMDKSPVEREVRATTYSNDYLLITGYSCGIPAWDSLQAAALQLERFKYVH